MIRIRIKSDNSKRRRKNENRRLLRRVLKRTTRRRLRSARRTGGEMVFSLPANVFDIADNPYPRIVSLRPIRGFAVGNDRHDDDRTTPHAIVYTKSFCSSSTAVLSRGQFRSRLVDLSTGRWLGMMVVVVVGQPRQVVDYARDNINISRRRRLIEIYKLFVLAR